MKTKHKTAFLTAGIVMLLMAGACSVQTCYDDTDPVMTASMLASGTGLEARADSLRVIGLSSEGPLNLFEKKSVSSFAVPLDPGNDVSTFCIVINGVYDTAVIQYTRHPHLVTPECGYTILSEITDLQTTHNIIDTLLVRNKSVNLNGNTNLHLFY